MSKQRVNFDRKMSAGSDELLFDQPPSFLLHTSLRGIEDHHLAALLQLGIAQDKVLASVVVGYVFRGRLIGMHPFGGCTSGQCESGDREHVEGTHALLLLGSVGGAR